MHSEQRVIAKTVGEITSRNVRLGIWVVAALAEQVLHRIHSSRRERFASCVHAVRSWVKGVSAEQFQDQFCDIYDITDDFDDNYQEVHEDYAELSAAQSVSSLCDVCSCAETAVLTSLISETEHAAARAYEAYRSEEHFSLLWEGEEGWLGPEQSNDSNPSRLHQVIAEAIENFPKTGG
jgi:hypothetical protein